MITTQAKIIIGAALLAVFLGLAGWAGYVVGRPTPAALETPAVAQSQPDGSVVLERAPETSAPAPKAKIPRGDRVERQVSVTVKPKPTASTVTVDMSLVRESDGGRRVIASSADGQVVGGLDVPVEPALVVTPARHWAAGASCNVGASCQIRQAGVWIERDLGRVRVGADVFRQPDGDLQARVRVGFTF